MLYSRKWGKGAPVIALHPLGLDSSGFAGVGRTLARRGMQTIAVDLPGFGRTPAPDGPLSMAVLAQPVIDLARELGDRPVVLGVSLGGRVALEAALLAPDAFRAVVPIAPYLPWRRFRFLLQGARILSPDLAAWLPLELIWPALRLLANNLEQLPWLRDDEMAQAGARLIYYFSCPATRRSFLSVARELALDPAFGENGLWTRLEHLDIPAAFVWGERDQLISMGFAHRVGDAHPLARQYLLPCAGHVLNGPHHLCVAEAIASLIDDIDSIGESASRRGRRKRIGTSWLFTQPCRVNGPEKRARPRPATAA